MATHVDGVVDENSNHLKSAHRNSVGFHGKQKVLVCVESKVDPTIVLHQTSYAKKADSIHQC